MKKINLILVGSSALNAYNFSYVKLNGADDSTQKATIYGVSKNLATQEAGSETDLFGFNELTSDSYLRQDTKYRVVSSIDTDGGTVNRYLSVLCVKKNGIDFTDYIRVTPLNLIKATSIGTNDKDTGNTLIYLPGVDALNSKDFNVYEVAQTPQALFTALKA